MSDLLNPPWDEPPLFVNGKGVKWWIDKETTVYARTENTNGVALDKAVVYFTEEPDGTRTRVLVMGGQVIYENPALEAMGVRIDLLKAEKALT